MLHDDANQGTKFKLDLRRLLKRNHSFRKHLDSYMRGLGVENQQKEEGISDLQEAVALSIAMYQTLSLYNRELSQQQSANAKARHTTNSRTNSYSITGKLFKT